MQASTTYPTGKEKTTGIELNDASHPDSNLEFRPDPLASALQRLLDASRDAEVLIACMYELHLITAAPLVEIWNRLAAAINEAQRLALSKRRP